MTTSAQSSEAAAWLPADLDLLAQLVEIEKCALILGPLASCDASGRPLRQLLASEIATEVFKKTGQPLADPENLSLACTAFMAMKDTPRTALEIIVRDFYKKHPDPSAILREAARLPFRLIFSAAPDENLQRAFLSERKRQFRTGFYRFSKTQLDDFDDTPADQTYLYQLFGRVADKPDGSLVLTTADQLEYMDSVQGVGRETRLPAGLRNAMLDCEAFLFIGFDFENWYLKILFHILKFSEKARLVFGLPEGKSEKMGATTSTYFQNQYKFTFLADRPLQLLEGIRQRLESIASGTPTGDAPTRTLLFLHSKNENDLEIRDRIDKQLAAAKRTHSLRSASIHDFEGGVEADVFSKKIAEASVIVALLSADFGADDALLALTEKALARQSADCVVAAVYARSAAGVSDFFKKRAPVFPAEAVPLDFMEENIGSKMVAEMLEKLIQTLPNL